MDIAGASKDILGDPAIMPIEHLTEHVSIAFDALDQFPLIVNGRFGACQDAHFKTGQTLPLVGLGTL